MIDLHSHILPGIDDGPADLDAAVALAAAAVEGGVRTIAATPHLRPDHPRVRPTELAGRVGALRDALESAGVDLDVVSGGELDVEYGLAADDRLLRLVTLGGNGLDLLVEAPYGQAPPQLDAQLFELQLRGYRVLLAHPERNPTFLRDPARLTALVERGILLQVTAFALAQGAAGSRSGRFALDLVREGVAHVIASDIHAASGSRGPALRDGFEAAAQVAPERAAWMVGAAPAAILAGEPLPPPPAASRRRARRGWRRSAGR